MRDLDDLTDWLRDSYRSCYFKLVLLLNMYSTCGLGTLLKMKASYLVFEKIK